MLIYHLEDNGKARLSRTVRLPDPPGDLSDMVIDPKGTIYILKGQAEVLGLPRNDDLARQYAIDANIRAQRLYLDGFNLFVQGADGKCHGVAAIYPGQSWAWATTKEGAPNGGAKLGPVSVSRASG